MSSSFLPSPSLPQRALITGGAGFIGSWLSRALLDRGWQVRVVDDLSTGRLDRLDERAEFVQGDVTREGFLREQVEDLGPFRCLVHLAGRVGVRRVLEDPEACRQLQVRAAQRVVQSLASAQFAPRVFAASTSEVYAESEAPLAEHSALRSRRGQGRWAYAASKLHGEELLDAGLSAACEPVHLRFFNVVGPGQDREGGPVLPTFVHQALAGEPLTVHGDGQQVRTFGHVADVAAALVWVIEKESFPGGPLNLGGHARTSILGLAQEVLRISGSKSPIVHVDPRRQVASFEEVAHREPDLGRARDLGLDLAKRDLAEIVGDTLRPGLAVQPVG